MECLLRNAAMHPCDSADIHISVLDTKQLFQRPKNGNESVSLAILTSDADLFAETGVSHNYDFLVFGVVPGSTFVTRSMANLEQATGMSRAQTGWRMPWLDDKIMLLNKQLDIVHRLGKLFGPDFELAVMCHIAAATMDEFTVTDKGVGTLAQKLLCTRSCIPEDWKVDHSYSRLDVDKLCAAIPGGTLTVIKGDVMKAISILTVIEGILGRQVQSLVAADVAA